MKILEAPNKDRFDNQIRQIATRVGVQGVPTSTPRDMLTYSLWYVCGSAPQERYDLGELVVAFLDHIDAVTSPVASDGERDQ